MILKSLRDNHISKKGPSPYTLYTKLADGVDFNHDINSSEKIPMYNHIHHKLPMGKYSHEREREIRDHMEERIQYEMTGHAVLTESGSPFYKVEAMVFIYSFIRYQNQMMALGDSEEQ